jgi:septal ring factor EnvC (AmiA/AmiB activator)
MLLEPVMSWSSCSAHAGLARVRSVLLSLLFLCGAFPASAAAAEKKPSREDLSKLQSRIQDKKADLAKLRSRESSVLGILERMDKEFDENNLKLEQLNKRIGVLAGRVAATAWVRFRAVSRLVKRHSRKEQGRCTNGSVGVAPSFFSQEMCRCSS